MKDYTISEMIEISNKYLDKLGVKDGSCAQIDCTECVFFYEDYSGHFLKCAIEKRGFPDIVTLNEMLSKAEEYIGKIDWTKVEVDTKILVRSSVGGKWYKKHFAKYKDEKVYAFSNGGTSFSSKDHLSVWEEAKLYMEDE